MFEVDNGFHNVAEMLVGRILVTYLVDQVVNCDSDRFLFSLQLSNGWLVENKHLYGTVGVVGVMCLR